jgi:VanZ family protein
MAFMPAVVMAAGIAILSLTEANHMPSLQVSDKLVHGAMYCALATALMGGYVYTGRTRKRYYILACAASTLYGGLMEALQRFCTLTRSGSMDDLIADFVGAVIGITIVAFAVIVQSHHRESTP